MSAAFDGRGGSLRRRLERTVVAVAADWVKIKNDYINGGGSYRSLAKKYGVSFGAVRDHALREGWTAQKTAHQSKIDTETAQLVVEKTAQALSDEAASKANIRARIFKLAEDWFNDQEKIKDTADFRRMVQTLLEMGIVDTKGQDDTGESGVAMLPPIMENPGPPEDDDDE